MKKLALTLLAVASLATATGCMRYNIKVGKGATGPAQTVWDHHFLWTLVGDGNIDVAAICGSDVSDATIHIERTFVDGLLTSLIGGFIWQPSTVQVSCGAKSGAVAVNDDAARKIVASPEFLAMVDEIAPDRLDDAHQVQLIVGATP